MKKHVALFSSSLMMVTTLLGAGGVFADEVQPNPAESKTEVSAVLTKDAAPEPDLPTGTTEDTDHNNNHVSGDCGIAYYPKSLSGTGTLQKEGSQEFDLNNNNSVSNHVGVKDTTREKHEWNLTAKVQWSGKGSQYMSGSSIKLSGGEVQLNGDGGALTPLTDQEVTGETDVEITSVPTNVMKSNKEKTQNGVYDYKFTSTKLAIPNAERVPANTYIGEIDWNLALVPGA